MKVLGSMIALGVAMLLASPAFAADTSSQPLTRADCDKAGMHWDDGVNVCASKAVAPKVEAAPKTEGAPKAEGPSKPVGAQTAKPRNKKHAYSNKKSTYRAKAQYKHPPQAKPVERHPFKWLFRNQSKPAGSS
jgi:hypothetical protein